MSPRRQPPDTDLYGPGLRTIAAQWETYAVTLPKNADAIQLAETRRAFYGGVLVCLNLALEGVALDAIAAEIDRFIDAFVDKP